MNKHLIAFFGLMAILFTAEASFGGVMVSLSSNPSGSPVVLAAGDLISFDVSVSGIGDTGNPNALDFLGVTVDFDAISLAPVSLTSYSLGPVMVDQSKGTVLFSFGPGVGQAAVIAQYDSGIPAVDPIISNGIFFTFTLKALSVATVTNSQVSISDASYFAPDFVAADFGSPVDVQVSAAAVPEPASWLIFGLGAVGLARARNRAKMFT